MPNGPKGLPQNNALEFRTVLKHRVINDLHGVGQDNRLKLPRMIEDRPIVQCLQSFREDDGLEQRIVRKRSSPNNGIIAFKRHVFKEWAFSEGIPTDKLNSFRDFSVDRGRRVWYLACGNDLRKQIGKDQNR